MTWAHFSFHANRLSSELLAPLTAASDLPIHPTLSTPFKSEILTQLTQNACEMTRKERTSLWKMKHLLTRLGGDHTWVPTGMLETEGDLELFREDKTLYQNNLLLPGSDEVDEGETSTVLSVDAPDIPAIEVGEHEDENNEEAQENSSAKENRLGDAHKSIALGVEDNTDDVAMIDASEDVKPTDSTVLNQEPVTADSLDVNSNEGEFGAIKAESEPDPDETLVDESTILEDDQDTGTSAQGVVATNGHNNGQDANLEEADEAVQDGDDAPEPRRMRTRAQAQAASDESPSNTRSASPDSEPLIDPYFLAPPNSIPDRNVGIPVNEADEVRRILQLYIQKQEEVCRGAEKVYNGLLKAERLRKTVLKWAKAEGHVGEMSDGEDWYDMEEWNLSEELKKGQDEEEEDAATTAKKTRTRRQ